MLQGLRCGGGGGRGRGGGGRRRRWLLFRARSWMSLGLLAQTAAAVQLLVRHGLLGCGDGALLLLVVLGRGTNGSRWRALGSG